VAESRAQAASSYKPIRTPRGPQLSCKGWKQEASLRLLMNSADPDVAEHPERLIVSSGIGKLARDWQAFHAITKSLQTIEDDETLVIRDGQPGPILKTNLDMPRVLVVNSTPPAADWTFAGPSSALPEAYESLRAAARRHFGGSLAGRLVVAAGKGGMGGALALAATLNGAAFLGIDADVELIKRRVKTGYCEVMVNNLDEALRILKNAVRKRQPASVGLIANPAEFVPELARRGVVPDLLTDQTYADEPYVPSGFTPAQGLELSEKDPRVYVQKALDAIAAQGRGMLELQKMGAFLFAFGNEQEFAPREVYANERPALISEYLAAEVPGGRGPVTIVALSGDLGDLARIDDLFPSLFPESELQRWIAIARKHPSPGLPGRSCWIGPEEAIQLGTAINDLVARGTIKAPVAMGRSIRRGRDSGAPGRQPPIQRTHISETPQWPQPKGNDDQFSGAAPQALADWPALAHVLNAAAGASWISLLAASAGEEYRGQISAFALVIDGQAKMAERIARLFAPDFAS
jgi:urocanate hydratase